MVAGGNAAPLICAAGADPSDNKKDVISQVYMGADPDDGYSVEMLFNSRCA